MLVPHPANQPLHEGQIEHFQKSWAEGVGKSPGMDSRDSRPIIKLWVKSSSKSPIAPKNPITQKPWLWTPLPHRDDTTSSAGSCQAKGFATEANIIIFFLLLLLLIPHLPGCFKAALRSHISEQCRLKGSTGNMTARRNSECHNWHIPHPFGMSSPFFWTPDWFWQPILGISYEREFCD